MRHNMNSNQRNILDEEGFDQGNILTIAQAPELPSIEASDRYSENPFILLPGELVSAVFFQFAKGSRTSLERHKALGLLAQICRRFRDIVDDAPELWTTVVIRSNVDASHLSDYLIRSRAAPLHVHIQASGYHTEKAILKELAAPVLAQAHRWKSLTITALSYMQSDFLMDMVPASLGLPRLSQLSLCWTPHWHRRWIHCIIPQYPNLLILEISDFSIHPSCAQVTTLQELVLKATYRDSQKWNSLFAFLGSNCAILRRLQLVIPVENHHSVFLPSLQVELPSLLSLTVEYSRHLPIAHVLDKFQAPRLSELYLGPEAPRVTRKKWATMDELLGTCLDRFGALNQIVINGLPSGASNAVRQDCRWRQMNALERGLSGVDVTVRIDEEVWSLKGCRS